MERVDIVLVEDNADDEVLTLRALQKAAVPANALRVVRDGQEALDYLADPARPLPRLLILDLKLPKVGGLEVLAALRSSPRTRRVPVVILTSSREHADLVAAYERGANAFVVKPTSFEAFTAAVVALAGFWLNVNEPPPAAL